MRQLHILAERPHTQQLVFDAEARDTRRRAREVRGAAAARGCYSGRARVITSERDLQRIEQGDVLVCRAFSPSWSILVTSVGAVVSDSGGVLSNAATIAREYGIPAVTATGDGTQLIRDGQRVTVDGDTGEVRTLM